MEFVSFCLKFVCLWWHSAIQLHSGTITVFQARGNWLNRLGLCSPLSSPQSGLRKQNTFYSLIFGKEKRWILNFLIWHFSADSMYSVWDYFIAVLKYLYWKTSKSIQRYYTLSMHSSLQKNQVVTILTHSVFWVHKFFVTDALFENVLAVEN